MSKKTRHVLGISGGKDSAALAIYLNESFPELPIEYYFSDTGKELDVTMQYIKDIETYLGKKIELLKAAEDSVLDPFDHFLDQYGGYLPSSSARWCTKKLKLEPFEKYVGDDPVISYVGIRQDENREGYVSSRSNIQTIFPYRKNIWSRDVIDKVLKRGQESKMLDLVDTLAPSKLKDELRALWTTPISLRFNREKKLSRILDADLPTFNRMVFTYLKDTDYPLSMEDDYPLLEKTETFDLADVKKILENTIGLPPYYDEKPLVLNGEVKGKFHRSRSGCFFCFYQQKIEWVWLFENHLELFIKAEAYEKDGYKWMEDASLRELFGISSDEPLAEIEIMPDGRREVKGIRYDILDARDESRTNELKEKYLKKTKKVQESDSALLSVLDDETTGCISCFL